MSLADRFWAKVDRSADCWLWTAAVDSCGYGRIKAFGKVRKANRVAWMLANGAIPDGQGVLHRCDTPACVKPDHLFLGSQKVNGVDMATKGRSPHARLTVDQVRAIRVAVANGRTRQSVASEYGVSRPAVSFIVSRRTWVNV